MTLIWFLGIAMGYVGAICTLDAVKRVFLSAESQVAALEAKIVAIKVKL
jgi:hypothetical protein